MLNPQNTSNLAASSQGASALTAPLLSGQPSDSVTVDMPDSLVGASGAPAPQPSVTTQAPSMEGSKYNWRVGLATAGLIVSGAVAIAGTTLLNNESDSSRFYLGVGLVAGGFTGTVASAVGGYMAYR